MSRSITVTRGSSRRLHVDLPVGDIDRGHPRRAPLQHAVGEAAGRGADVEAVAPGNVDAERLKRVVELDPAARDETRPLGDDQRRLGLDQLARPQRDRPIAADAHGAGPHRARRGRARGKQAPLGQNRVYSPRLRHPPETVRRALANGRSQAPATAF